MRGSTVVLSSLCIATTAFAGGEKPTVDAAHFVDESTVYFQANHSGDGFWVRAGGEVVGAVGDDEVYLEVKQGGKLLEKIKCSYAGTRGEDNRLSGVSCGAAANKKHKVTGPIQADLILRSDQDDKLYLLRTFNVNVKKWDNQVWQIEPDDLLGAGYVALRVPGGGGPPSPEFRLWLAGTDNGRWMTRCKVNGKTSPEIPTTFAEGAELDVDIIKGDKRTHWFWTQTFITPDPLQLTVAKQSGAFSFAENPGTWSCELRHEGALVRELVFTVGKDGKLVPPAMQNAKGAPKLGPDVVQADLRIGKDNGVDQRIKPDVLKKSRGFGLAWQQDDGVKTMLAALPAAYENANPVAKKEKGKLLIGAEQNPPKTVDHSLAWVQLGRNGAGYRLSATQEIVGVTSTPSDRYRLDIKQSGKLLGTGKCSWGDDFLECIYEEKPLMAKGAIEASVILSNDSDPNEYVLNTYKVNVAKFPSFGDPVWQIVPDDVLATAWVYQTADRTSFRFWMAVEANANVKMRCTVDGKKKLEDFELGRHGGDPEIVAETYTKGGDNKKYIWAQVNGTTNIHAGLPPKDFKPNSDAVEFLGQHPGQWECDVRREGKVARKLLFKVNAEGFVEADPAQTGMPTHPNVVPIDLRFGKDTIDTRVRPDAMKKSRGFGLPWPKPPTKPFPPASGLPDPK